jgi:hypothetical protein
MDAGVEPFGRLVMLYSDRPGADLVPAAEAVASELEPMGIMYNPVEHHRRETQVADRLGPIINR